MSGPRSGTWIPRQTTANTCLGTAAPHEAISGFLSALGCLRTIILDLIHLAGALDRRDRNTGRVNGRERSVMNGLRELSADPC